MFHRLSRRALWRCAAVMAFCQAALPARAADEFAVTAAQMQALGVQLQRLEAGTGTEGPTYPARVVLPPGQVQVVSAPLPGVVDQLLVGENDPVRPGQPLLRLASPELGELQLKLMEATSQGRLAARTLQRERQLFAEGIIPQRRVQEAEANSAQSEARLRQSEAALRLAGVDPGAIRRIADGGTIESVLTLRARAAGVVSALDANLGQRVQPADSLVRITDASRLWLDVQVPLTLQGGMAAAKGLPVTVIGREVSASVQSVGSVVSDSQTLTLRANVMRGAQLLRPGEFVQVRVPFASKPGWTVPIQSVVRQGEKPFVFVRTPKGFLATPVTVFASAGQTLRIAGDLKAGQEIATGSVIALKAAWQGKGGSN